MVPELERNNTTPLVKYGETESKSQTGLQPIIPSEAEEPTKDTEKVK